MRLECMVVSRCHYNLIEEDVLKNREHGSHHVPGLIASQRTIAELVFARPSDMYEYLSPVVLYFWIDAAGTAVHGVHYDRAEIKECLVGEGFSRTAGADLRHPLCIARVLQVHIDLTTKPLWVIARPS